MTGSRLRDARQNKEGPGLSATNPGRWQKYHGGIPAGPPDPKTVEKAAIPRSFGGRTLPPGSDASRLFSGRIKIAAETTTPGGGERVSRHERTDQQRGQHERVYLCLNVLRCLLPGGLMNRADRKKQGQQAKSGQVDQVVQRTLRQRSPGDQRNSRQGQQHQAGEEEKAGQEEFLSIPQPNHTGRNKSVHIYRCFLSC